MCSKNKKLLDIFRDFVHGYIAGSCVSFDQAVNALDEELESKGITLSLDELEEVLSKAISDAELFCCENCGWWCYEHDRSEEGTYCSDCEGE